MSSTLPSDEVAEDYKASLEDLAQNSRYEISNLTVIAKENTEHAMAISRVLENHIRKVGFILPVVQTQFLKFCLHIVQRVYNHLFGESFEFTGLMRGRHLPTESCLRCTFLTRSSRTLAHHTHSS